MIHLLSLSRCVSAFVRDIDGVGDGVSARLRGDAESLYDTMHAHCLLGGEEEKRISHVPLSLVFPPSSPLSPTNVRHTPCIPSDPFVPILASISYSRPGNGFFSVRPGGIKTRDLHVEPW